MIQPELPHSIDAEKATLGSILMNRDALTAVASWLSAIHFYLEKHAAIYAAMYTCYTRRTPPDIRLVAEELRQHNKLDEIGGYAYLSELFESVPTSDHIEYYADIVRREAMRRFVIEAGGKIVRLGFDSTGDTDQLIADAQAVLRKVTGRDNKRALVPISTVVDAFYDSLASGVMPGLPTGFRDLDEMTGGLHKGDLTILAARPSVGKTSLALCLADQVAASLTGTDSIVAFFSMEMGREQLNQRMLSMISGVDLMQIRHGRMRDRDLTRVMEAAGIVHSRPLWINDTGGLGIEPLRALALQRAMENEVALIIVDYLQLMRGSRRTESRVQEINEISRGLKELARELNVPVIALSQLSRAVEGRTSHVPVLSDLRDGGSIEQDGDIVMFIYREELYEPTTDKKGIAEIHYAKHRNGPIGVVPMRFDARTTRFMDLTYRTPDGY